MLTYSIGDIHGRLDLLEKIIPLIFEDADIKNPEDGAEIIFLGDYIDRGPDSKGVVDYIIDLQKNILDHDSPINKVTTLRGNHEDFLIEAFRGNRSAQENWVYNGGWQCLESYGYTKDTLKFQDLFSKEHEEFYLNTKLYYQVDHVVFVHAGLDPSLTLEEQSEQTLIWSRRSNAYDGEFEGGYFVVHGHTPLDNKPSVLSSQINIDTGAVFGGALTCCIIDTKAKFGNHRFIQVK
jgi:serine/threonine protein phosphatase 1